MRKGPAEPRVRNTQERLRGDHIETLELLQASKDENGKLKKTLQGLQSEIKRLKSVVNGGSLLVTRSSSDSEKSPTAASADAQSLLKLREQLIARDSEIKLLQQKIKQHERDALNQMRVNGQKEDAHRTSEKLRQALESVKVGQLKEAQLQQMIEDLQYEKTELEARRMADNSLELRYQEEKELKQIIQAKYTEALFELEDAQRKLTEERSAAAARLTELEGCLSSLADANTALKNEVVQYSRGMDDKDTHILKLVNELSAAKAEASGARLRRDAAEAEAAESKRQAQQTTKRGSNSSKSASEKQSGNTRISFQLARATTGTATPATPATVSVGVQADLLRFIPVFPNSPRKAAPAGESSASPKSFDEFVRLRRENKELKLRLAETASSLDALTSATGRAKKHAPPRFRSAADPTEDSHVHAPTQSHSHLHVQQHPPEQPQHRHQYQQHFQQQQGNMGNCVENSETVSSSAAAAITITTTTSSCTNPPCLKSPRRHSDIIVNKSITFNNNISNNCGDGSANRNNYDINGRSMSQGPHIVDADAAGKVKDITDSKLHGARNVPTTQLQSGPRHLSSAPSLSPPSPTRSYQGLSYPQQRQHSQQSRQDQDQGRQGQCNSRHRAEEDSIGLIIRPTSSSSPRPLRSQVQNAAKAIIQSLASPQHHYHQQQAFSPSFSPSSSLLEVRASSPKPFQRQEPNLQPKQQQQPQQQQQHGQQESPLKLNEHANGTVTANNNACAINRPTSSGSSKLRARIALASSTCSSNNNTT